MTGDESKPAARTEAGRRRPGWLFWATAVAISGAGAVAAVRGASPFTLDEKTTTLFVFFLLPALPVLLLGWIRRAAGIAGAILIPWVWLAIFRGPTDSHLLWLLPLAATLLILYLARAECSPEGRRPRRFLRLIALAAFGAALAWPMPSRPVSGSRVILVGIDGASWKCIDPLVSDGRLPCFERLLRDGHRADLCSLHPMFSPQIWSTIATGHPAAVHGIMDFASKQWDFKVGRIWDLMKQEGRSIGVCGWLFTWPPIADLGPNDFVIPNVMAPDACAHPAQCSFFWNLAAWEHPSRRAGQSNLTGVFQSVRHGIRLSTMRRAFADLVVRRLSPRTYIDQHWRSRKIYTALQADMTAELIRTRRPEFVAVLFSQIDPVCHWYWKYYEPEHFPNVSDADCAKYAGVIDELYVETDRGVEKIMGVAPTGADLLIVSDHGFQARQGTVGERTCRIRTENLLDTLAFTKTVFGSNVDDMVYLRPLVEEDDERERVLTNLAASLAPAHLYGEDRRFFKITRGEGALKLEIAPRGVLPPEPHLVIGARSYPLANLVDFKRDAQLSGVHHEDGVWLLVGPAAAHGLMTDSLNVLDVAPTVAALLDLPAAPGWTGRPALEGVRLADMKQAAYPLPDAERKDDAGIDEALKAKMRSLGYLE